MKRALVLILSLALVMCIAIPALAADDVGKIGRAHV